MTRCCILHCNGACPHQKQRVERNGKSVYRGHCATAAECAAGIPTLEERSAAVAAFLKRCSAADERRAQHGDDERDDEGELDGEVDEETDEEVADRVLRWFNVGCDICNRTMQGRGFFHHNTKGIDVCQKCWQRGVFKKREYVWWRSRMDPYGKKGIYVHAGYVSDDSIVFGESDTEESDTE